MEEIIQRIQKMEEIYDEVKDYMETLLPLLETFDDIQEKIKVLMDYQASNQWMDDFIEDEEGNLPSNLKRGVLSEDGLYDLIMKYQGILEKIKE